LRKPDPDVSLDLQSVFGEVYARARYHLTLRYDCDAARCLSEAEQAWLRERMTSDAPM
jgi:hypothetical protein